MTQENPSPVSLRFLIVAETSIPGCLRYRVTNKADALRHLGHQVRIVSWWDMEQCRNAMQLADAVIFYRVGCNPSTQPLFDEAKRLNLTSFFETDDLIFDELAWRNTDAFAAASPKLQRDLLEGVRAYRRALLSCTHAIASTRPLADVIETIHSGDCLVVSNCIHPDFWELSDRSHKAPLPRPRDKLVIGYGSGTPTHDTDFAQITPALRVVLQRNTNVELALHGSLAIPEALQEYADRITLAPCMRMDDYLPSMAFWDISIACLRDTALNRAKSPVKFLEAALMKIPSICSAIGPYQDIVTHGHNGILARSTDEWIQGLSHLIESPQTRAELGERAYELAKCRFHLYTSASTELAELVNRVPRTANERCIFYVNDQPPPISNKVQQSFFKTVIEDSPVRGIVFSATDVEQVTLHGLQRVMHEDLTVLTVAEDRSRPRERYWNAEVAAQFERALNFFGPELVLVFEVERLGFTLTSVCKKLGIPYVIFLDSSWWLSRDSEIASSLDSPDDLRMFASRADDAELVYHRYFELRQALMDAQVLVALRPNVRDLYVRHGIPEQHIVELESTLDINRLLSDVSIERAQESACPQPIILGT